MRRLNSKLPLGLNSVRCLSVGSSGLKEKLIEIMPAKQAQLKKMKTEHGSKIVDKVTIDQVRRRRCAA